MHIAPKKSLGQNFLTDKNIISKTVAELDLKPEDFVLEIGPGEGALTEYILAKTKNVLAVELDQRACEVLKRRFSGMQGGELQVINMDFLGFNFKDNLPENFRGKRIKILGNIPYYISGRIFFKLFENAEYISRAVITVQKEVAERIVAKPKTKEYGILSVLASLTGKPKKAFDVSSHCFYPRPNVTSAVVTMNFFEPECLPEDFKLVADIVKAAFNQRRKMLSNSFKNYFESNLLDPDLIVQINEIYGNKRAEELVIEDYVKIYSIIKND
ncbi:MAG: 16S rRNA (adenine(1518)-N(6)/adenine(1519)-N(6))-dimethyltransferase RsmA [bacterium]